MGDKTAIGWTDATWNPVTGCDQVSPGCDYCYALNLAPRLKAMGSPRYQNDGDPRTSGPGFAVTLHPDVLDLPLRWSRPRMIFVNSMSDLFHPRIPDEFIARVFAVMALSRRHTFQVLTKRAPRMRALLNSDDFRALAQRVTLHLAGDKAPWLVEPWWPLPNVWGGVSVEDEERARQRIPALLDTPLAVRWLSMEPLLAPVDAEVFLLPGSDRRREHRLHGWRGTGRPVSEGQGVDWVVAGGESGPHARPMDPAWVRTIRDQCVAADVPFFFKQWGGRTPKTGGRELDGRTWDQYPRELAGVAR